MKYLALGDSYTIGEGVDQENTFPYLLSNFLNQKNITLDVKVVAQTGWTCQELFEAYEKEKFSREFDLVTLLIGVNNQYRKHDFNFFAKGFETMLNEAISKSKEGESKVFVLSIPNYGLTPFGEEKSLEITEELKLYNQYIKIRCALYGVHFVEIDQVYNDNVTVFLAEDKLHPSGDMYQLWVDEFKDEVYNELKSSSHIEC